VFAMCVSATVSCCSHIWEAAWRHAFDATDWTALLEDQQQQQHSADVGVMRATGGDDMPQHTTPGNPQHWLGQLLKGTPLYQVRVYTCCLCNLIAMACTDCNRVDGLQFGFRCNTYPTYKALALLLVLL
jgi:hypothetical protein